MRVTRRQSDGLVRNRCGFLGGGLYRVVAGGSTTFCGESAFFATVPYQQGGGHGEQGEAGWLGQNGQGGSEVARLATVWLVLAGSERNRILCDNRNWAIIRSIYRILC